MLIDWFTVGAQVVNFLVLVYLLKRFLYGRILEAMERRETIIAERLAEAERSRAEAAAELEAGREAHARIEAERERLLAEVRRAVDVQRAELLGQARRDVDETRSRWTASVAEESQAFLRDLRHRAAGQVVEVARRALADLAGQDLETWVARAFERRLAGLDDGSRADLIRTIGPADRPVVVRSAFELPDAEREHLTATLAELLGRPIDARFETSELLVCGIELRTDGHRIAWDLGDHLDALERSVRAALDEVTDDPAGEAAR